MAVIRMAVVVEPKLTVRSMLPPFQLTTADGQTINRWDYKGRKNLALVFLSAPVTQRDRDFLDAVAESAEQYREENTVFLVILRGDVESAALLDEMHPPFPILYDQTGEVTARYTDVLPAVFVADRFGELYAQWIGEYPSQRQILDVVELINLECPE